MTSVSFANAGIRVVGSDIQDDAFYFEGNVAKGNLGSVFQCALEKADYQSSVEVTPFQRSKVMLEQGQADVIFPLVQSIGRDHWAGSTDPVIVIEPAIVSKDESLLDIAALEGKKVSTVRGSVFHEMLIAAGATVVPVPFYQQGIDMVAAGRTDATVVPLPVLDQSIEATGEKLRSSRMPVVKIVFYVSYQSERHSEILEALNDAIDACTNR
jgi:ABC-type amino acid transport substrate-binding protein